MKAVVILSLLLAGCGASADTQMAKSRQIYRTNDSEMQYILNSISDRLDKLEGRRGSIEFDGQLVGGVVPLDRIVRAEFDAEGPETATLLAFPTEIVTVNVGTVGAGDRLIISAIFQNNKGGTGGLTFGQIDQSSGTAEIEFLSGSNQLRSQTVNQTANESWIFPINGICKVLADGTLTLHLGVQSNGSVGTASAEIHVIVLRNSI